MANAFLQKLRKAATPAGILTTDTGPLTTDKAELLGVLTPPATGTAARPTPVQVRQMPAECLFDDCGGRLSGQGNLYQCDTCRWWFEHRPTQATEISTKSPQRNFVGQLHEGNCSCGRRPTFQAPGVSWCPVCRLWFTNDELNKESE